MGKQGQQQLDISHPRFHRQTKHLFLVRPPGQTAHLWHVSQVYEAVKYSDALVNLSGPVQNAFRRISPYGYDVISTTWNNYAPTTIRKRFAILTAAPTEESEPTITVGGHPITIHDFRVTLDDCGLGHLRETNQDVHALTHHVAMGAVRSRQKRSTEQQQRKDRRLAEFEGPAASTSRKRMREDDDAYYADDYVEGTDFTPVNQTYPDQYVELDADATMAAPDASTTEATAAVEPVVTQEELAAAVRVIMGANVEAFHQLPLYEGDTSADSTEVRNENIHYSPAPSA